MRRVKHRDKLLILLALFLVLGVGFATLSSSDVFLNAFVTSSYGVETVETFESPTDWTPGDVTSKTVTVENTGSVCERVRISYTESWKDSLGDTLPLEYETGKRVALLNLANTNDWIYNDGYYYYNDELLSGEITSSFLDSITFNPEYAGNLSCTTVDNVTNCGISNDSYLGGSYEITFIVETIQCDAAPEEWNMDSYLIDYQSNGGSGSVSSSLDIDQIMEVQKPTKSYTLTFQNNVGARLEDSLGESVSSISQSQVFDGWTASGINTSTAKYGTSRDNLVSWSNGSTKVGASDSSLFFQNLTNPKATATLTANWISTPVVLPTIINAGFHCVYNTQSDGSGTSYASGANYTPSVTLNAETLYIVCDANAYRINYAMNGGENGVGAPSSVSEEDVFELVRPTKNFTITIDENSQNATISSLSVSSNQPFTGWTGSGLGNDAKYGTSSSLVNNSWNGSLIGDSNSSLYFKELASLGEIVSLTANWSPVSVLLPTISKSGSLCHFNTESDDSGVSYNGGESYTPTSIEESFPLYAICYENQYTIQYALNGGVKGVNGPTSAQRDEVIMVDQPTKSFTVNIDANSSGAVISSLTASRNQYFNGWTASSLNTSTANYGTSSNNVTTLWNNGSNKVGANTETMYFKNLGYLEGEVVLTANWNVAEITLPTVLKKGYFCYFNTESDGSGTSYGSGSSYVPPTTGGSQTLYARCVDRFTITLNNQSADVSGTTTIYEVYNNGYYLDSNLSNKMNSSSNYITVPSKTNYTFGGYYTEINGEGVQYIDSNGKITSSADPTHFISNGALYANWVVCDNFSTDSWSTVVTCVKEGYSGYHVGDTKTVTLGNSLGTHTIRIANTSTPAECSTTGFSQTACGFVLEFADIITTHRMNPYTFGDTTTIGLNSKGGWEYSDMRAYLNSTTYAYENIDYSTTGIYSSLPEVLRNAIIDTSVVSGHNSIDTANFTTTDKLYLLSIHEVYEDDDGNTSKGIDYHDKAYYNTRQLDYYAGLNVAILSSYSGTIKQRNGSNDDWLLRSADFDYSTAFLSVLYYGDWVAVPANFTCGVSPAFRIG